MMKIALLFLLGLNAQAARNYPGEIEVEIEKVRCDGLLLGQSDFPLEATTKKVRYEGLRYDANVVRTLRFTGSMKVLGEEYLLADQEEYEDAPASVTDFPSETPGEEFWVEIGMNGKQTPFVIYHYRIQAFDDEYSEIHYTAPLQFTEGNWTDFLNGKRVVLTLTEFGKQLQEEQVRATHERMGGFMARGLLSDFGRFLEEHDYAELTIRFDGYRADDRSAPTFLVEGNRLQVDNGQGTTIYRLKALVTSETLDEDED